MSLTGTAPYKIYRTLALNASGTGVATTTLAGTFTMTYLDEQLQNLDPDGSNRDVVLPVADKEHTGVFYAIYNSGNNINNLVVKDVASTILTLADGESGLVACNGSNWKVVMAMPASTSLLGANNTWTGTNAFGVDGTGVDVTFFGDTASRQVIWDQSADVLRAADNTAIGWGSGAGTTPDIAVSWDATRLNVTQLTANSEIRWGVDAAGIDQMWYGDTASTFMTWDQSADSLIFADNAKVVFGSGSDITFAWDATSLKVTQAAPNSAIQLGVDGAGIDLILMGDTASATATWDQSDDSLVLAGVAKIKLQTIAAATGTAIPVTHSGSFPVTTAAAETNTLADPTFLGQTITIFVDTYAVGDRVITAASRINQAANTIITLGAVGDFIRLEAISIAGALRWQVVANDGAALS